MDGQNYANHVHQPRLWAAAWLGAVLVSLVLVWVAFRNPSLQTVALVFLGLVTVVAVSLVRTFALRLQDRIIRLEMQMRLTRLGLESAVGRLSLRQLIALRFASDAELPALIERAIAENLSSDQIKRAVRDWQGDFLRT